MAGRAARRRSGPLERMVALATVATAAAGSLLLLLPGAAAQGPRDAMVQPPTLRQPERGSLVGSLAKFSIGAEDLSRGSFAMSLPIVVPSERGVLLAPVLPSYAPENGISEWGVGWSADISIRRFRLVGDIDYETDAFTSPWGRLEQGSDGRYYPAGLAVPVRLERRSESWVATGPDGTSYVFGAIVSTTEGPYAWYLTRIETLDGDAAKVEYVATGSVRPFVKRVLYGGREDPETYALNFEYETLPTSLIDYRSGHPLMLDRRVIRLVVGAKVAGGSAHQERWRYDIDYRDSAFGPAFYLDSVMRMFASGESEPPVSYDYDLAEETTPGDVLFPTGDVEDAPGVSAYLSQTLDPDGILPERAALTDIDDDGLADLEHGHRFTLFHQTAAGAFVAQPLPPAPPDVDSFCRPPDASFNQARTLVRMAGASTDLQVLVLEALSSTTEIRVCDLTGVRRHVVMVQGLWTLGANMKVVDLNRDERPDLLLVDSGAYSVLENISGSGCSSGPGPECVPFGFSQHPPVELAYSNGFPFTPTGTWAHDMNGDGNPDLVQRTDDRMSIWYGRGRFRFDELERQLAFLNRDGAELQNLNDWEVQWFDVNKDGLTDALMALGQESALFINEGDHFQEVVASVLENANLFGWGVPVFGDLRASGELDLNFVDVNGVAAVELTTPSMGLLQSAADGKGTVLTFGYERAAAVAGLRQRPSILKSLTVETAGYDAVTYQYDYGAPTIHTVGHYLVGFDSVQLDAPQTSRIVEFYHDDDIAGTVETTRLFDARTSGLVTFTRTAYEEARHADVRLRRGRTTWTGWCAGGDVNACIGGRSPAALDVHEFLTYERDICPAQVRTTNRHGQLVVESALATPALLAEALHCTVDAQIWTGTHATPARNFRLESRLTLNDRGQPTKIEQLAGDVTLVLQEIAYDQVTNRVISVSTPGGGAQTFTHDPATGHLLQVVGPDGVVTSARSRSPTTDSLLELASDRGPGGLLVSSFRYDGMERLAKRWSDFGGSSETVPLETIEYKFPTNDYPSLVEVSSLVDAAVQSRQERAEWGYPDGAQLAIAERIPGRWDFGAISAASRSELRTTGFRRSPLLESAGIGSQTYESLLSETTELAESTGAGFGHEASSRVTLQQGVERRVATTVSLAEGLIITAARENDAHETRSAVDASGRLVWQRNQTGATTRYDRDALGRLIGVTLVDGTRQHLSFDAFGRPAQVVRDGVGTITYSYESETGRLDRKDYRDADGVLERTVDLEYDAIGRVVERVHVLSATGDESRFRFRYDGDVGDGEILAGQKGYVTRIEGPAYAVTTIRNADGSEASSSLVLGEWMQIDLANTYYANGVLKEALRTVTRLADGAVIDDVTMARAFDAWGRLDNIAVNGEVLAAVHYDDEGRFAWADLLGGQRINHFYDPVTHEQNGYSQVANDDAGTLQTGMDWGFNSRGLVASETFDLGDQSWLRTYRYDARGFLDRAQDASQTSTYSYTTTGLPKQITDERGTRAVFRGSSRTINVAGTPYVYDASGRVTARGAATYLYGPDGHLSVAHFGSRTLTYAYDAEGNRVLKLEDGVPVAGFVGGGYLTDDAFISPVEIDGRTIGVLEGGVFHLTATDPRGTLLADRDGTPRLASAYGVRTTRPDLSSALDYVEKAYDSDLESVRMGVRDYDPMIGQFWTPDPLYLERIDRCAESPVDCNLLSYAHNNPVTFIDPTGMDWKRPFRWIGREVIPRVVAASKVVGAGVAFGVGFGLCETIVGCVAGAPLMGFSADVGQSGVREVWYGKPQPTVAGMVSPKLEQVESAAVTAAALYGSFAPKEYLPGSPPVKDPLANLTPDELASGAPPHLRAGSAAEESVLAAAGLEKNTRVMRPTLEEMQGSTFQAIVGPPKVTAGGQPKGTIFDSATGALTEVKTGTSSLTSSYQLRLQVYFSVRNGSKMTIMTNRPIAPAFAKTLKFWGIEVVPLPLPR